MSQIPATNRSNSSQAFGDKNSLNELDIDSFFGLMIAELQNQDPLNPLENDELLAQISQIREVGATEKLTETLDSVLLGQNIASATNLIGADVVALTDSGERVTGNVRRVTIDNGTPKLDLALGTDLSAPETEGSMDEGEYTYEVVWSDDTGNRFSSEFTVDTENFGEFNGSVRVGNLPETTTPKSVYRTDRTGTGDRMLVGSLAGGGTSFIDTTADAERSGDPLTGERQRLNVSRRVTVTLNNIAQIEPPEAPST